MTLVGKEFSEAEEVFISNFFPAKEGRDVLSQEVAEEPVLSQCLICSLDGYCLFRDLILEDLFYRNGYDLGKALEFIHRDWLEPEEHLPYRPAGVRSGPVSEHSAESIHTPCDLQCPLEDLHSEGRGYPYLLRVYSSFPPLEGVDGPTHRYIMISRYMNFFLHGDANGFRSDPEKQQKQ